MEIRAKCNQLYLTFEEAADEYNVSETCLRNATKDTDHPLPVMIPRGQKRGFRLYRPDLEKWLRECTVTAGA